MLDSFDDVDVNIPKLESFDFGAFVKVDVDEHKKKTQAIARKHRITARRTKSEKHLGEIFPELKNGYSYHFISQGDVDSLSFVNHIISKVESIEYLMFSTWCMANDDITQISKHIESGKIKRIDCYVGEIFPTSNQYSEAYRQLSTVAKSTGGRVAVFRNHAKIFIGKTDRFHFAIESSANINTNPRCEQTAVHLSEKLFRFYKEFFDGIKSFQRDFDDWKPYKI